MRFKLFTLLSFLIIAVMLAACDGSTATKSNGATPAANTTSNANRPFGFGTPGAQRPGQTNTSGTSANGNANNNANGATTTATPQATSAAPTAVPLPSITMPTPVPTAAASSSATTTTPETTTTQPSTTTKSNTSGTTSAPAQSVAPAVTLADLKGKVIFFSDRDGGYPQLYVMNADGSNQQVCNCSDLLQAIVNNDITSPDKQQFLFVKTVGGGGRAGAGDIQVWRHNNANNTDEPVTGGAPGFPGVDYDPAWSPDSRHIAFVTETNGPDEIYLYDAIENSNVRLTESAGEWYKHPSFSPDGSKLVYWTNVQNVEKKQVWVMNLDGSGKTNLSNNNYNDWDPIFVKE